MVKYLENGRTFTEENTIIDIVYKEISKEEFDRLNTFSFGEVSDMVLDSLDKSALRRGFYGATICVDDDGYYIKIRQGK